LSHKQQSVEPETKQHAPWCLHCCTMHREGARCPGELLATGVERHGWRIGVVSTNRTSVCGVLLAPAGQRWRARIITYPNVLWVVPGGGTMKFVARTPEEAERLAVRYIKEHCRIRGWITKTEIPLVDSGCIDSEQDAAALASEEVQSAQRKLHRTPIRYGIERPTTRSRTGDLSEGGLFVLTSEPLPVNTDLRLYISLNGFGLPLRGTVQWNRAEPDEGRPPGMGIRLHHPHPRYVAYVRQQCSEGQEAEGESRQPDEAAEEAAVVAPSGADPTGEPRSDPA
jgi:hypothetical protein